MNFIPFETSSKPWFGPRKRAIELLAYRTKVLPPDEAIKVFRNVLGHTADQILRVRFIDYVHHYEQQFRYTIALMWIGPDADARDDVYDRAERVVRATGWYPLPQGERLNSRAFGREFKKLRIPVAPKKPLLGLGDELRYIQSAVSPQGGCSIRIATNDGSLLIDTGLPGALTPETADQLVLLSHSHLDHSGGIASGACDSLPSVMSTATARLLVATGRVPTLWLRRQAMLLDGGQQVRVGGVTVSPFMVPHCPGSVGYVVRGANGAVVFTGDLAFKSARHDFVPELSKILSEQTPNRCTVLVEATMASRAHGATKSKTATALLGKLSEYKDIALVSTDVEQLLYAFLDLFHTAKGNSETRSRIELIATTSLRPVFEVLHSAFISRQLDLLDPFLTAQYGKSMSSWAESRWLYWLGQDCSLGAGARYNRIWFVTKSEMGMVSPRGKMGLVPIGRLEGDASFADIDGDTLDLDTAVWTLHSDEASLYESVRELPPCNTVLLFHNFPKRLRKFVAANGLSCGVLDTAEFPLNTSQT